MFEKPKFASGVWELLPAIDILFGSVSELRRFVEKAGEEGVEGAGVLLRGLQDADVS